MASKVLEGTLISTGGPGAGTPSGALLCAKAPQFVNKGCDMRANARIPRRADELQIMDFEKGSISLDYAAIIACNMHNYMI